MIEINDSGHLGKIFNLVAPSMFTSYKMRFVYCSLVKSLCESDLIPVLTGS